MIVDLPPHAIDLPVYLSRKLLMSCRPHFLRFMRKYCQWGLQAVRKVAGLCDCPRHPALTVVEQCIELINDGLYLGRIGATDTPVNAFMHSCKAIAQAIDGR
jgi:hypothetical protein